MMFAWSYWMVDVTPNAVPVQFHHYVKHGGGDDIDKHNWHVPNPSDPDWKTYDWTVYGHEVAHDFLGFDDNMGYDKDTVMSPRSGPVPRFEVTEFDVELLLNSIRVNRSRSLQVCECMR